MSSWISSPFFEDADDLFFGETALFHTGPAFLLVSVLLAMSVVQLEWFNFWGAGQATGAPSP